MIQVLGDFGLGGDGRVARELSTALAGRGARATCVALRSGARAVPEGGTFNVIHLPADRGLRSLLRAAAGLRRIVAREAPDLLHVHGPQSLVFAALALHWACAGALRFGLRGTIPAPSWGWDQSAIAWSGGRCGDARACLVRRGASRSACRRHSGASDQVEVFRTSRGRWPDDGDGLPRATRGLGRPYRPSVGTR